MSKRMMMGDELSYSWHQLMAMDGGPHRIILGLDSETKIYPSFVENRQGVEAENRHIFPAVLCTQHVCDIPANCRSSDTGTVSVPNQPAGPRIHDHGLDCELYLRAQFQRCVSIGNWEGGSPLTLRDLDAVNSNSVDRDLQAPFNRHRLGASHTGSEQSTYWESQWIVDVLGSILLGMDIRKLNFVPPGRKIMPVASRERKAISGAIPAFPML
ncbi:hypothetical protein BU17DRAFT_68594 [Hysterangium stoloniferum]|nr:hypothetical protein BU17DRAFT_68594 [Hysterangium stoloniferum]